LRYVADLNPAVRPDLIAAQDAEVSFLPMEAIGEDGALNLERLRPVAEVRNGYSYFENGDVAFAKVTPCFENGKGALMRDLQLGAGFGTSELTVLRPKGDTYAPFLNYVVQSAQFRQNGAGAMTGAGGLKRVPDDFTRDFKTPWPVRSEQERIANFLDEHTARIDALIAAKEALASSLKDIEEVTAYDLVTRGVQRNVARVAHREEWLREAPAHWGLQKLRQLATIGNGSTPKRDNEAYWAGGQTPWLNSGAVNAARITEASDLVTPTARKECHLPLVRVGSTVVALTGQGKTRGTASITEIETTINQHLAFASLFDARMSDEYLWVLLTGMYSVLRYLSDGEGSTKGALTCEQLNQLRVLVPPLDEQRVIVAVYQERITAVEALRGHAMSHIDRLREYRSSLISAAVTGQLDISTFELKEAA
jgi:type I restriction enzyme S subunit